ncbi:MAG: sel1 repeat family protein [Deltaproteobacteria bacterium]|jgi:hypothetical protein|nr:sel1 repeat family protein [Deltaproteobacteria bacterium]
MIKATRVDLGDQLLDSLRGYFNDKSSLSLNLVISPFLPPAERGVVEAQYTLGKIYELLALGERKLGLKAANWYRLAAEAGFPGAQVRYSRVLRDGDWGVEKNTLEALKWLRRAAEAGQVMAQFQLAESYKNGALGLPKDLSEAAKWFALAAERGHEKSEHQLGLAYLAGDGVPQDQVQAAKWLSQGINKKKLKYFVQITEANLNLLTKVSELKFINAFYLEKKDPGYLDGDLREDYQSANKLLNKLIMKFEGKQEWEDACINKFNKLSQMISKMEAELMSSPHNVSGEAKSTGTRRQKKKASKRR